ncbi:hypothetical protein QAD02_015078, partial [Eretmocerus hayati]
EPLRHLHEIHDKIHQMRDLTLALSDRGGHGGDHLARFSTSCPSLCPLISIDGVPQQHHHQHSHGQHMDQDGSDPDLLTNCSTNSSPTHFASGGGHHGACSQILQGIDRRRSWTDLEDSRQHRRGSDHNHLTATQNIRQRSISLSSLESDLDLELDNKSRTRDASNKPRTSVSQSSTHSLNEADFIQNEFKKVVVKRGGQRLGENHNLMPGVTGSRLPLQKSISTPSIVIPPGQAHLTETGARVPASLSTTAYDDRHLEKTKKKRGSLFSRKKKDKSGKKPAQQHQWAPINVSSQGNNSCDFCMKSFSNKPALHCESCGAIIHQAQTCKDSYNQECTKSKPVSKSSFKSLSGVSISSSSSIVKRSSSSALPLPASNTSGNQTINEERDGDGGSHRDVSSGLEENDFDEVQFSLEEFDRDHPELGLGREEPDSWSAWVGRQRAMSLAENDERKVKRQEHIYEFILTEKHHCLVLLAMQRVFVDNLRKLFGMNSSMLDRMFPKLQELMDIHFRFLSRLRLRQSESQLVPTIADLLIEQFSDENSNRMKNAYGEFCSRHRDAVDAYKQYQQADPKFAKFVRHCQNNPLLKKKGIHECILFVTQRLTKYPLLVEPLIKTGTSPEELVAMREALSLVKNILKEVDACVADKERTDRKLDIYHKIDPKSWANYRGNKFKKSDILASNRNLKFEGSANFILPRSKPVAVLVVCLTDVLFFLTGDQKYVFFIPDDSVGVLSLQGTLMRDKDRTESRIYLIHVTSKSEPSQMFELEIKNPRDKKIWFDSIRDAVKNCPQERDNPCSGENDSVSELKDARSPSLSKLSSEERSLLAKESRVQSIHDELRKVDESLTPLFEHKMELHMKLYHAINAPTSNENSISKLDKNCKGIPDYLRLIRGEGISSTQIWKEILEAVQEAMRLAQTLTCGAGGGNLSRSVSSAGERHSEAYVPASLAVPRRAETFAGFDHNKERSWRDSVGLSNALLPPPKGSEVDVNEHATLKDEDELDAYRDQREVAVKLSHNVHTLLGIINNQMTTIESLQAQLASFKDGSMSKSINRPNPNRQLEELRNLQDQLSRERDEFRSASQQERAQLEEERAELNKLRNQLSAEQRDVETQRDQLYRKLEALSRQGVPLSTTGAPVSVVPLAHSSSSSSSDACQSGSRKKSQTDEKGMIPQNLFSATNQQKVQQLPVKQQLPLKLASISNNSSSRGGSFTGNNSPDRHSRTGSSPAVVGSSSTLSSPELGSGSQQNNGSSALSYLSMSNRSNLNSNSRLKQSRNNHLRKKCYFCDVFCALGASILIDRAVLLLEAQPPLILQARLRRGRLLPKKQRNSRHPEIE